MKPILLYVWLISLSCAGPLRKPRMAGYGSKSEEMMQFGPYGYVNSPQLASSFYGYHPSYPQMFPQWPVLPLQKLFLWQPSGPAHQATKIPHQTSPQNPATKQPIQGPQPKPQLPPHQPRYQQPQPQPQPKQPQPPEQPQKTNPTQTHSQVPIQEPKEGQHQQPQAFPPFPQQPWHFPQMFGPGGFQPQQFGPYQGQKPFGRPPVSNEEGIPYFGYGYHGLGNRPPYISEEMFEQDFEKPKEKEPPKESPAADPAANSTFSNTNSSIPASQGGNATVSGLSTTDKEANLPVLPKKFVSENGIPTSPIVHGLGQNEAAHNGFDQSSYRPKSRNGNAFQSFPSSSGQFRGHDSYIYKSNPDVGDARHNILMSRGNPSTQAENPTQTWEFGQNSVHRDNLQRINSNHPTVNDRPNSYGQQEELHYLGNNPSSWRESESFPSSGPGPQWNRNPVYRNNEQPNSPSEGYSLDPRFDTLERIENVYKTEENTNKYQPSRMHQADGSFHQGMFSGKRGKPFGTETHKNDWKEQSFIHPHHEREHFASSQNEMWRQENLQKVKEAPPGYHAGPFHQRGHAIYTDKNSYSQQTPSVYPKAWEDRENSLTIGPLGQWERRSYSPALSSDQMHRSTFHENNQQDYELYPRQNTWRHEKRLPDLDRQYQSPPYNPTQYHADSKHSADHPANGRGNLPNLEINRQIPEEHFPVHGAEHYENIPYHMTNERNLPYQGPFFPLRSTTLFQRKSHYDEGDTWVPQMVGSSAPKEASTFFNPYSTDFRRNPTYIEDAQGAMQVNAPISNDNTLGTRYYPNTGGYPDEYPREHGTTASHPTVNHFCCADDSPRANENLLAPLRIVSQLRMASREQKASPPYPEGSHDLYAPYLAGIQSNNWNNSLNIGQLLPSQRENPGGFGEEVADLQNSPPCFSFQFGQVSDHEANDETGLSPSKSVLCSRNSIRGDGHPILAHIMGVNQPKREFEGATLKFPEPQRIRNEALVSEVDRKEYHATYGFQRTPCFGSWLKQYISSTRAPSVNQHPDIFYAENSMIAGNPIHRLPEPQPISSTIPSHDTGDNQLKFSFQGEELVGQPNES